MSIQDPLKGSGPASPWIKKISCVEKYGWKPHERPMKTLRVRVAGGHRGGKGSLGGSGEVGVGEPAGLLVPALVLSFAFPTAKGWQRAMSLLIFFLHPCFCSCQSAVLCKLELSN